MCSKIRNSGNLIEAKLFMIQMSRKLIALKVRTHIEIMRIQLLSWSIFAHKNCRPIFTARKRSLQSLCFYRCLSVHGGGGWRVWQGQILRDTVNERAVRILLECILVTGRNEVVAKVMFLQVCVCPQGGRVSASVHAGMPDPPDQADTPPSGSRLQHTVYERAAGTHPTRMHSCL